MRLYTFYCASSGDTYTSSGPRSPLDRAIPDRPGDMPLARFDPELWQWERVYAEPDADDIDLGDAERLWALAEQEDDPEKQLLARLVMQLADI